MWLVHVMRFLLEWRQGCCGVGNTTAGPVYDVHCASYYLFFILFYRYSNILRYEYKLSS